MFVRRSVKLCLSFLTAVSTLLAIIPFVGAALSAELPDPLPCSSCFIGKLVLTENIADASGTTKLLADDLYFVDPDKFVWKAGKGDITDGASIPPLFKPLIGESFESDFLPAAIIHDHYTNRSHRVRHWRDTAKVFYQAMLVNGVNVIKAKTMYFAVYSFGPHWDNLAAGVPCGARCIFSTPQKLTPTTGGNVISMGAAVLPPNTVYAEEPANLVVEHTAELQDIRKKIEAMELRGTPLTLKDLDTIATLNHSDNIFLQNKLQ